MAANTPFKKLVCRVCNQWKIDRTGKAKGEHCGAPMVISDNWYVRVTVAGRTTTKSVSPRKRDAEDYIANCKTAARQGVILPGQEKDITWEQAGKNCKQWWEDAVATGELRQSTATFYKEIMPALDRYFGGKTLLTITKGDVMDYRTARANQKRAAATINHDIKTIKRIYAMHVARTSSEESPRLLGKAMDISRVELCKKDGKKVRFLDETEIKHLLSCATTEKVRIATLLALNTGLRLSNVIELTWKEVRLSKKVINLPAAKMKSRRDHTVDIPAHLVEILKKWRSDNIVSAFLFPDAENKAPITNFRTEWVKTITATGFNDVTFHTMRHTFSSQFLMHGGDLSTLSEILDHADIGITKNIYGHMSREHKRKATDHFAAAFLANL